jgi:hypothetical protein
VIDWLVDIVATLFAVISEDETVSIPVGFALLLDSEYDDVITVNKEPPVLPEVSSDVDDCSGATADNVLS